MKKILLMGLALFATLSLALAQDRTVSGKVTSADDGSAIPGVNIIVKGTTTGAVTDIDGNYKLSVPASGGTLIFSFIGLESQEVEIGSRSVIDVAMESDAEQLSEVVVTGFGEREKAEYTGSITQVGTEGIENRPVNTIDQVLQGSVPGLQLSASSGTPGAVQDIRIRGLSSLTASNSPLFVIDGVPVNSGTTERGSTGSFSALASLNPNDIESMSVLKDATATALYGARGANGVIIITTKKGKSGKATISFNAQYGTVDRATDAPNMLSAPQWDELYYEGLVNAGFAADIAEAQANFPNDWDGVTDTDWTQEVLNTEAVSQTYDLSINGGNERTNYYASLAYFQQDGVNIGSNFDRFSGKVNIGTYVNDKVYFSNSFNASRGVQNGQLEGSAYFGSPDAAYMFLRPTDRPRNADGSVNITDINGVIWNPLYFPDNDIREIVQFRILNNSQLKWELIENLDFVSTLGIDYLNTEEHTYNNRVYGGAAPPEFGSSYMYWSRTLNYVWKNQLNYKWEINSNNVLDISAVYEAQKNDYKTIATGGYGFAADGLYYPSSVGTPDFTSGFVNDWAINSITGLLTYSFANKLFVDASIRSEGNSRFAPEYRWGTFWAAGAAYILTEEAFLSGNNVLTFTKFRGSYGKTGNAGVALNSYQSFLSYSGQYNSLPAVSPGQVGNSELTWENNFQLSLGLDVGLWDRLDIGIEYYNRLSTDLLFNVPLSRTTGFANQTQNLGEMVNKGWEVVIKGDIVRAGDFVWNLGINFTTVDNEVTKLPRDGNNEEIGIETSTYKITEGQPAYIWYMPTWAGVDPANGDALWYTDDTESATTNDYNAAEDVFQPGARIATLFGGIDTRLEWRGFYLTANIYYQTGNYVWDTWGRYNQSDGQFTYNIANGYARQFDRWQQPGDNAANPRNVYGNPSNSNNNSSRRLYDGTFLRLRNVTLGYDFPTEWVNKAKLQSARLYIMGNNFATWKRDPLLEFDPEVGGNGALSLNPGVLKTFSVGLNLSF